MKNIALIGFMGSGKSTTGIALADHLHHNFVDLDDVVVREAGRSVAEVFAEEGEAGWRQREIDALRSVCGSELLVLACGGGIILRREARDLLKLHFITIYLFATPDTLVERLSTETGRPLLDVDDRDAEIQRLSRERLPKYSAAADVTIKTDGISPEQVAQKASEAIARLRD